MRGPLSNSVQARHCCLDDLLICAALYGISYSSAEKRACSTRLQEAQAPDAVNAPPTRRHRRPRDMFPRWLLHGLLTCMPCAATVLRPLRSRTRDPLCGSQTWLAGGQHCKQAQPRKHHIHALRAHMHQHLCTALHSCRQLDHAYSMFNGAVEAKAKQSKARKQHSAESLAPDSSVAERARFVLARGQRCQRRQHPDQVPKLCWPHVVMRASPVGQRTSGANSGTCWQAAISLGPAALWMAAGHMHARRRSRTRNRQARTGR